MNIYQNKLQQLEQRTVDFSVDIIKSCSKYSQDPNLRPLTNQLIRSATSVGANYAEANNAASRTDFRSKIFIAKKEVAETRYWLRILRELLPDQDFSDLQQEALEFNLIFQRIISTLKNGK